MANTRDILGDQATLDGLVSGTLTSLEEDGVTELPEDVLQSHEHLLSVTFPNLTKVNSYTFGNCFGLTVISNEDLPNLSYISDNAFRRCMGLVSVKFPSLNYVGSLSFSECSNLESFESGINKVTFGNSFGECIKLKELIINSNEMSTIGPNTLKNTQIGNNCGVVYVKDELVQQYKTDQYWKYYMIIPNSEYPLTEYPDWGAYFNSSEIIDAWTEVINNENYLTDYELGKTLPINFGSYGVHQMELIAMDTDIRADGDTTKNNGKARMTWMCKDILTNRVMNNSYDVTDGWASMSLRSWLITSVFKCIPEIVRNNIVEVNKTYYDKISKTTKTSKDIIWIPSMREMFGGSSISSYLIEDSGVYYTQYFDNNSKRIKKLNTYDDEYWTRTTSTSGKYFHGISSSGSIYQNMQPDHVSGVVPCFCI